MSLNLWHPSKSCTMQQCNHFSLGNVELTKCLQLFSAVLSFFHQLRAASRSVHFASALPNFSPWPFPWRGDAVLGSPEPSGWRGYGGDQAGTRIQMRPKSTPKTYLTSTLNFHKNSINSLTHWSLELVLITKFLVEMNWSWWMAIFLHGFWLAGRQLLVNQWLC